MSARHEILLSCALAALLMTHGPSEARYRPGNPADMTVTAVDATALQIGWRNTASKDDLLTFQLEQTTNGVAARAPGFDGLSGTGAGWTGAHGMVVRDLTPETDYCFRVWARIRDNDVQSAGPSNWACARTPPHLPLMPLDVRAVRPVGFNPGLQATVEWTTPEQAGNRRITHYTVERQSPPGPNRPWLPEATLAGPDGAQTTSTKLAFRFKSSAVTAKGEHIFRVCAVNEGGRTCAKPVALVYTEGTAEAVSPTGAIVRPPIRTQQVTQRVEEQPRQATRSAPANSPPSVPQAASTATNTRAAPAAAAKGIDQDKWARSAAPAPGAPSTLPNASKIGSATVAPPSMRPLPEAPSTLGQR